MDNLVMYYDENNELQVTNNTENNDKCGICQDLLSNKQVHQLDPCNHIFHTECIVNWFRLDNDSCPYCRNDGLISYDSIHNVSTNWKITFLKNYSRRNNAPKILKQFVNTLRNNEEKLKLIIKEIKEFPSKKGIAKELLKENSRLRIKKWTIIRTINRNKRILKNLSIIPLYVKKEVK